MLNRYNLKTSSSSFLLLLLLITSLLLTCDKRDFIKVPAVIIGDVTEIGAFSAMVKGDLIDFGEGVINYGHCWSTDKFPTISHDKTELGSNPNESTFISSLSSLNPNTTYYVRSYVISGNYVVYSDETKLMTDDGLGILKTHMATEISHFSVRVQGRVSGSGGDSIISRGICWLENIEGEQQVPTIETNTKRIGSGVGHFSDSLNNLKSGTEYRFRAFATNEIGTIYGDTLTFTTLNGSDLLSTPLLLKVRAESLLIESNSTPTFNYEILNRGVCWNNIGNPTISDYSERDANLSGKFIININDLSPESEYYVRAYAITSYGALYSQETEIKTRDGIVKVSTGLVSPSATMAKSRSKVDDDGGSDIIARGVCWSTQEDPTISDYLTTDGVGVSSFASTMTNLSPSTRYYIKAYATNKYGTSYGSQKNFYTDSGITNIQTSHVKAIKINSARAGGVVSHNGGDPIIAKGVCWNTIGNPTVMDNKTIDGSGLGSFSSFLNGLSPNTTYYVRSYTTNNILSSYGSEVSFTTYTDLTDILYDFDSLSYYTVLIGSQKWMAQNLASTTLNDGTPITPSPPSPAHWKLLESVAAYAWPSYQGSNKDPFGALYNWTTVETGKLCPIGWHVPSNDEWSMLIDNYGGNNNAGGYLKSQGLEYWNAPNQSATNESGFSALPAGYITSSGGAISPGTIGIWWSSTSEGDKAWYRSVIHDSEESKNNTYPKSGGLSIRCLKD